MYWCTRFSNAHFSPRSLSLPLHAEILLYAGLLMHAYPGSLADIIAARQAHGECLSMEEALLLLVQMLYGAESGHEAGVVHQ